MTSPRRSPRIWVRSWFRRSGTPADGSVGAVMRRDYTTSVHQQSWTRGEHRRLKVILLIVFLFLFASRGVGDHRDVPSLLIELQHRQHSEGFGIVHLEAQDDQIRL